MKGRPCTYPTLFFSMYHQHKSRGNYPLPKKIISPPLSINFQNRQKMIFNNKFPKKGSSLLLAWSKIEKESVEKKDNLQKKAQIYFETKMPSAFP